MNEHLHTVHDDLLVKYLLEETSPEETRLVEQWLSADPANRHFYEHFRLIWNESRHLADGFTTSEETAWQKFRQRIHQAPASDAITKSGLRQLPGAATDTPNVHRRPLRKAAWLRIAALFLLVASITAIEYLGSGHSAISTHTVASLETPLTDTLPDGSLITLNRHSAISYPEKLKGDTRMVALKGEAFFQVMPDSRKPFQVHLNGLTLTVLGTSFNIRDKDSLTEIVVETGLIRVTNKYHSILAGAHEKIILRKNDSSITKEPAASELYKYYRTHEFVCDNTPLGQLVEVLNEAYDVHIVIDNPALQKLPLSTTFRNESLDHILSVISETFGLTVKKSGDRFLLQ